MDNNKNHKKRKIHNSLPTLKTHKYKYKHKNKYNGYNNNHHNNLHYESQNIVKISPTNITKDIAKDFENNDKWKTNDIVMLDKQKYSFEYNIYGIQYIPSYTHSTQSHIKTKSNVTVTRHINHKVKTSRK